MESKSGGSNGGGEITVDESAVGAVMVAAVQQW